MIRAELHDWWASLLWKRHQRLMRRRMKLQRQTTEIVRMVAAHHNRARELRSGPEDG